MKKSVFIIVAAAFFIVTASAVVYACENCGCAGSKAHEHTQKQIASDEKVAAAAPKVVEIVGNKICPVMKGEIVEEYAVHIEYKGKVYSFCCPGCIEEFKKDPEKYVKIVEEMMKDKK